MLRRPLFLLLLMFLARCGATPIIDCKLTMVAQMPMRVEDNLLIVPAGINGKWVNLVVDSGAERTTIGDATADRLGLPRDPKLVSHTLGIGGASTTTDATIGRLVLGGVHFPIKRIAVGKFDLRAESGLQADGLLGADILLAFDLDIDVPDGKLTLYRSRICPDAEPPWPTTPIEIQGVSGRKDRLLLPFELDGTSGKAILDTGAQGNVLGVAMARRMGLDDHAMVDDPSVRQHGVGPGETISHLHQFKQMRIGPVTVESPKFAVLSSDFGVGDALIGESFLRGRRVWLSFRNRQVFITRRSSP